MTRRVFIYLIIIALAAAGYFLQDKWLPQVQALWQAKFGTAPTAANKDPAGGKKKGGAGPITVIVAKAQSGSLPITRQTIGTIVPTASSILTSSTSGILADVLVKDGANVKKDDLVARLDSRVINATINKDQATLVKDQATLENANTAAKRAKDLLNKGLNSKQAGDDADTAAKVAAAAVNVDQAVLAADQVTLSLTEIHAPFDGKLGTILLSPGAFVSPGTSVATITQLESVYAEFSLPDRDAELIHKSFADSSLTVEVSSQTATQHQTVKGPIVFVDSTVDLGSGTFKMRAKIPNADGKFLSGQAIDVDVTAGTLTNLILVPNQAVTPTATGNAVFVVKEDSTVEVRPVEIALRSDNMAGLSKGLSENEQVVVEGQINLVNGAAVKIGEASPSAGSADPAKGKKKKPDAAKATEGVAP